MATKAPHNAGELEKDCYLLKGLFTEGPNFSRGLLNPNLGMLNL